MKDIKRIMFATDFSEISNNAKDLVIGLATKLDCEVDVVHVFEFPHMDMPSPYYFMPGVNTWIDEHLETLRSKGNAALNEMVKDLGEGYTGHFCEGRAKLELVTKAKELNPDMIVMGTHGHGGFNRLVMGSVAEYVMRHVSNPVLTVRGEETDS